MHKFKLFAFTVLTMLVVSACSQRAATSQEAIELSKAKQSVEEQVDFLIGEANAFVNSQKFDEAINTAKYVLAELDKNSQEAQSIIEKAKAELERLAREKMDEAKAEANKAIDDVKGKISSFGK